MKTKRARGVSWLNRVLKLTFIAIMASAILFSGIAYAARAPGIVILIDLTHGQPPTGIEIMMKMIPEAHWYILVPSSSAISSLPPVAVKLADGIIVGSFSTIKDEINKFDVIIIGQPQKPFTPDEISVIKEWFYSGADQRKVLWVAGDSDYPAQGGSLEIAMHTIDDILKSIGSHLREDFCSVEDYSSNAGRPYRVVGLVEPDPGAEIVAFGAHKVLFHGPGVLAYVDKNGNWKPLNSTTAPGIYRLVWTSSNAKIVEYQPRAPGAPGSLGKAHTAGDRGKFVLMAAEVMHVNINGANATRVVIVSSETPYGGYQPMVTYMYHGVKLDGPRFFRNVILWSTGYMGELQGVEKLINENQQLSQQVKELQSSIGSMKALGAGGLIIGIIAIIIALIAVARRK